MDNIILAIDNYIIKFVILQWRKACEDTLYMRQELNFERIGKNIRATRIQQNLTQEYLADTIDVNVSHISNIENNRVKVSLTALVAICNVLNVSVDYILKQEYTDAATASALDREIMKAVSESPLDKKKKILQIIRIL